ncbi:MAG TPA: folate-binding protein [Opitutaceae bacterium]|jgi:folate-binding protein YgfZ|nr:folate-binding protein [Opitutaceae bacterium]
MHDSELTAAHIWRPAACLQVAGPDAFTFLQGQFTNDLRLLDKQPAVYGLWLNQKGRVLADSFVLRAESGAFWVGSYFSPAQTIRERLEANLIADDAKIEDCTEACAGLTLVGSAAETMAETFGVTLRFAGRRKKFPSVELLFSAETLPAVEAQIATLSLPQLPADDMELLRIKAGMPAVPLDIGPDDLPNEAGLEADAISYTKGCYLGQEVMARLKSMGQVRRRLLRVTGTGAPPATPAVLFHGPKKMGELRSVAPDGEGFVGLAMLTLLGLERCPGLSFAPESAPVVHLVELPKTKR